MKNDISKVIDSLESAIASARKISESINESNSAELLKSFADLTLKISIASASLLELQGAVIDPWGKRKELTASDSSQLEKNKSALKLIDSWRKENIDNQERIKRKEDFEYLAEIVDSNRIPCQGVFSS